MISVNGVKDKTKLDRTSKKISFFQAANNSQNTSKIESYLSSALLKKFGGSYEEVRNQFPNGESFVAVNLVPSEICYKDTPYSAISKSQIPAIVMLDRDYRGLQKLRFSAGSKIKIEKTYCKVQQELMEKGEFWMALRNEVAEILVVSKFYELNAQDFANYTMPIIQMLQYCKDASIPDVPNGHLISSEQYSNILKHFKLKHEVF